MFFVVSTGIFSKLPVRLNMLLLMSWCLHCLLLFLVERCLCSKTQQQKRLRTELENIRTSSICQRKKITPTELQNVALDFWESPRAVDSLLFCLSIYFFVEFWSTLKLWQAQEIQYFPSCRNYSIFQGTCVVLSVFFFVANFKLMGCYCHFTLSW